MTKFIATFCSAAIFAAPMLLISAPASAKTATQQRMENRTKAYNQKSAAKHAASKAAKGKK
jgi:Ni/Co efflux regulator RcnB